MNRLRKCILVSAGLLTLALASSSTGGEPPAPPSSAVPALPAEVPASAVLHSVLMSGNAAGTQATWRDADGKLRVFFDRGRGPRIWTEMTSGADGIPTSLVNTGVDYLKGPVEERFGIAGGKASWKNKAEHGERDAARAFYSSMYGPPEELAVLARALLAAGGRLPLLPDGEARIERVGPRSVEAGGSSLTQYQITGLDFSPTTIWLDADQRLFATGAMWFMVIRKGAEGARDTILAAQREAENRRAADLAHRLAHRPAGDLLIHDAYLFDPETATIRPGQTIVISGERIKSVAPSTSADRRAAGAIDAAGRTVIPGLWDMHAHVSGSDGLLNLAAGVTTVRDLANDTDELEARRARIDAGEEIGTRIVAAGFMDGPGPYQGPTKVLVSTEAEVRALESEIDRMNADLPALRSFVLPGGCRANVDLHVCRTVCRRAERITVTLAREQEVPPEAVRYLNRLSDAFFVWSRWASHRLGVPETLWEPNLAASGKVRED